MSEKVKLPKYLQLNRGAMWFDVDGPNASGIRLFSIQTAFIGRGKIKSENGIDIIPPIPEDKFKNKNEIDYGYVNKELTWYFDTTTIPPNKLENILNAFRNGILVKADPTIAPKKTKIKEIKKNFNINEQGDQLFNGKNKEMYKMLMSTQTKAMIEFIKNCEITPKNRINLIDLCDYEMKGFNPVSRPRLEILDLIRNKIKKFGNGITPLRKNELK